MEEKASKSYEVGYLARGEEGSSVVAGHLKRIGGEISLESEIRNIKLTYPIKHHSSAYFGYVHFEIDPELVDSLKSALRLDNQIIRSLIITPPVAREKSRTEPEPAPPRKMAKPKVESGEDATVSNDLLEEKLEEILR